MTSPDQTQEFLHSMGVGISALLLAGVGGTALYKFGIWGFNRLDSYAEYREIKRYKNRDPKDDTTKALLDSNLPLRPVIEFLEERDRKDARTRDAMDRRAHLGQRGGEFMFGGPEVPAPPRIGGDMSDDDFVRAVEDGWQRLMDNRERYPETNGISPEALDSLTTMYGGPRSAAYYMRHTVDPAVMIERAEPTQ